MKQFLPAPLLGVITFSIMLINLMLWAVPVYLLIFIKLITRGRARIAVSHWIAVFAQLWASANVKILDVMVAVEWDIRGVDKLDRNGQYMAVSNHQSYNDIPAVMKAFDMRAPFFKFFMKQELIWVPILGLAWWGLDFPFMKRYTPEQVAKKPELKGKDLATTRAACEKFQHIPVMILNYLEGTRFTQAKHERQESPYKHLLLPKSGGFAFAMSVMGSRLHKLLDITVVYPEGAREFWDMISGRVARVIVDVRQIEIPDEFFHGNYGEDMVFRKRIQDWIQNLWEEKDQRIEQLLLESGKTSKGTGGD